MILKAVQILSKCCHPSQYHRFKTDCRIASYFCQRIKRGLVTTNVEPCPNESYYERPVSLVYYQSKLDTADDRYSSNGSVSSACTEFFPYRGVQYIECEYDHRGSDFCSSHEDKEVFDSYDSLISNACSSLHDDLMTLAIPSPVLLTSGCVDSVIVQFYLESHYLSGLIMINPALPSARPCPEGTLKRTLKLEASSVPMLILSGHNDDEKQRALSVADYHAATFETMPSITGKLGQSRKVINTSTNSSMIEKKETLTFMLDWIDSECT